MNRIATKLRSNEDGLTILQILVVIGILVILAAIAVPTFTSQKSAGVDSSVQMDLHTYGVQVELWKAHNPSGSLVAETVSADAPATYAEFRASLDDTSIELIPQADGEFQLVGTNPQGDGSNPEGGGIVYDSVQEAVIGS
ncbi:type IV pilin protein [Citricoccus zhacaiensis]